MNTDYGTIDGYGIKLSKFDEQIKLKNNIRKGVKKKMITKEHEDVMIKFGKELEDSCKKYNLSGTDFMYTIDDYIETIIDGIIKNYPEIDDTFVYLPEDDEHGNCQIPIDITFTDGTETRFYLTVQVNLTFKNPNKMFATGRDYYRISTLSNGEKIIDPNGYFYYAGGSISDDDKDYRFTTYHYIMSLKDFIAMNKDERDEWLNESVKYIYDLTKKECIDWEEKEISESTHLPYDQLSMGTPDGYYHT